MRFTCLLGAVTLGIAASPASAACTGTPLNAAQLQSTFSGKLVCGRPGSGYPTTNPHSDSDRWQEEHVVGGALFDFKRQNDPDPKIRLMDPRKQVGTWSIAPGSLTDPTPKLIHRYSATDVFPWTVYGPTNNVYSFCTPSGAEHVRAFVVPIDAANGCNNVYP